jgi:hypothetical protein
LPDGLDGHGTIRDVQLKSVDDRLDERGHRGVVGVIDVDGCATVAAIVLDRGQSAEHPGEVVDHDGRDAGRAVDGNGDCGTRPS